MDNRHLVAGEGMILTNGEAYAVEVWLGDLDSPDNWREIPREEYEAIQEAQVKEADGYEGYNHSDLHFADTLGAD